MKKVLVFLICVTALYDKVDGDRVRRFIGGHSARAGQFPYMVSLRRTETGRHFCGGSIIHRNFILTAAHCLEDKTRRDFYVVAGTNIVHIWRKRYFVEKIAIHVHYDDESITDDIALIKLKKGIKFSKYIQKIPLSTEEPPIGVSMTLSGWGYKYINGDNSYTLQYSNLTSISLVQCRKKIRKIVKDHFITKRHMCTYDRPDHGFCDGDSGGPLVYNGKQVGIVSWAISCAVGFPDVYVKVASYVQWIEFTKKKLKTNFIINRLI